MSTNKQRKNKQKKNDVGTMPEPIEGHRRSTVGCYLVRVGASMSTNRRPPEVYGGVLRAGNRHRRWPMVFGAASGTCWSELFSKTQLERKLQNQQAPYGAW